VWFRSLGITASSLQEQFELASSDLTPTLHGP